MLWSLLNWSINRCLQLKESQCKRSNQVEVAQIKHNTTSSTTVKKPSINTFCSTYKLSSSRRNSLLVKKLGLRNSIDKNNSRDTNQMASIKDLETIVAISSIFSLHNCNHLQVSLSCKISQTSCIFSPK